VPDISLFPQLLIKRVDVVNGGASASYGSDAVGGVVNFITDTHFKGLKGNVQGGITNYGDDAQYMGQIAYGKSFLQDRLHFIGSVEFSKEAGIGGGQFGTALANGRNWFQQTSMINRGILNDGSPQYLMRNQVQSTTFTKYGLITAGPLQGIAFDATGNPFQFQYGSNGVPQRNAAGTVAGCYPGFCLGGDLSGNVDAGRSLQSALQRLDTYGRLGFDIDNRNEVYMTFNFGKVNTHNQPVNGENKPGLTFNAPIPSCRPRSRRPAPMRGSPASSSAPATPRWATRPSSPIAANIASCWVARGRSPSAAPTGNTTSMASMGPTSPRSMCATSC
jgi:outer membrane receptor protein involved in Fe transport